MSFLRDPKRLIATIIAGLAGILVLLDVSGQVPILDPVTNILLSWTATLAAIALLIGLFSVAGSHVVRIVRKSSDWGYSLVLIISMVIVIFSGTVLGLAIDPQGNTSYSIAENLAEEPFRDLFVIFYQPLASSFLALLAFFSLSAMLRAVQRRTAEALVITVVALLVLVTTALPPEAIPVLGESVRWASDYLALAGARALLIGTALGAIVAGVRVLLGFDQPYLDR
jgi:hypothetical protein